MMSNANPDPVASQFALAVNCIVRSAISGSSKKYEAVQHLKLMFDLIARAEEQIPLGVLVDAAVDEMKLDYSASDRFAEPISLVVGAALKYYLELIATDNASAGRQSQRLESLTKAIDLYIELERKRRGRG